VRQRLTGGSRVGGRLARGGQVGELGRGLCRVVLDVLCNGACANVSGQCFALGRQTPRRSSGRTVGHGVEGSGGACWDGEVSHRGRWTHSRRHMSEKKI